MPPTVIITDLPIGEFFARAVDNARKASAAIDELLTTPLRSSESRLDRALDVARHARVLSEAFSIIDSLADGLAQSTADEEPACDCPACSPRTTREPGAPVPPHMN